VISITGLGGDLDLANDATIGKHRVVHFIVGGGMHPAVESWR